MKNIIKIIIFGIILLNVPTGCFSSNEGNRDMICTTVGDKATSCVPIETEKEYALSYISIYVSPDSDASPTYVNLNRFKLVEDNEDEVVIVELNGNANATTATSGVVLYFSAGRDPGHYNTNYYKENKPLEMSVLSYADKDTYKEGTTAKFSSTGRIYCYDEPDDVNFIAHSPVVDVDFHFEVDNSKITKLLYEDVEHNYKVYITFNFTVVNADKLAQ